MDKPVEPAVTVLTPESDIRKPIRLLMKMVRDLIFSRELAWRLFVRDLSAQYRQSLLGVVWAFVPPIMTSLVFISLHSRRVINFGEPDIPYPVYVLVGTIIWQVFTESLNAPLKATNLSRPILAKISFPHEALILSSIYSVGFGLLIKLVVLTAILLIFQVQFTWATLIALPAMLALVLLGIGLGLLITPFGMLYTDVSSALPVVIQLWFLFTPVVYFLPDLSANPLTRYLNPVTPLLNGVRDLLTRGGMTNLPEFLIITSVGLVLFLAAWLVYRVSIPILIERISA